MLVQFHLAGRPGDPRQLWLPHLRHPDHAQAQEQEQQRWQQVWLTIPGGKTQIPSAG